MAVEQDSTYFPSLDKCLTGEDRLISWKLAHRVMTCSPEFARDSASLEAFLADPQSLYFLCHALDPFAPPDAKTKADFDTKTAPINVSQPANGNYSLEELKTDALWLSEKLKVAELVALRIVILEWQHRARDQLIVGFASAEQRIKGQVFGVPVLNRSLPDENLAHGPVDSTEEDFRRHRQCQVLLEEKSYILKLATELVGRATAQSQSLANAQDWFSGLANRVVEEQCFVSDVLEHENFLKRCLRAIVENLEKANTFTEWPEIFKGDEANQTLYLTALFLDTISMTRLLLANIFLFEGVVGSDIVQPWFKLLEKFEFFQNIASSLPFLPDLEVFHGLVAVVSISLLQLPKNLTQIWESAAPQRNNVQYSNLWYDRSYMSDDGCVREINLLFVRATKAKLTLAAPVVYAWSLIVAATREISRFRQESRDRRNMDEGSSDSEISSRMQVRRQSSTQETSRFEKLFSVMQDYELEPEQRDDPATFFASRAVDEMDVYSVIAALSITLTVSSKADADLATSFISRDVLLELVRAGMESVMYGSEVLQAILAILSPSVPGASTAPDLRLADELVSDATLRLNTMDQALARYPFELIPFLKLFTAVSISKGHKRRLPDLLDCLENLPAMTVGVNDDFKAYTLDHEDENANSMVLTRTLPMFISRQARAYLRAPSAAPDTLTMGSGQDITSNILAIPAGTSGVIVKESRPMVFKLDYSHSGLEYLGLLLSTALPNCQLIAVQTDGLLDRDTASEIILFVNALLKTCSTQAQRMEEARTVLGRLSYPLHDEQDIILVITNIFELELLSHLDRSVQEGSLALLVACAEFFGLIAKISPERVWSALARSCLLGINGGTNALAAVVGATEIQTGRFLFLTACVSLHSTLVDHAISGISKRQSKAAKSANRFDPSNCDYRDSTPERTVSTVLAAFNVVIIDVWQSLPDWHFAVLSEKFEVTTMILETFNTLLHATYGIDATKGDQRLFKMLVSPATELLSAFAPRTGKSTVLGKVGPIFMEGLAIMDDLRPPHELVSLTRQTKTAAQFLSTLLRTAQMEDQSGEMFRQVGSEILQNTPSLAALLGADIALKESLSDLFAELVRAVSSDSGTEPTSLLQKLSTDASKSFLLVVSQLDAPLREVKVETCMWNFLSALMSARQQWFAMYLLTGSLPRDRLKNKNYATSKTRSLFKYALEHLSNIADLAPDRATCMLKFVASAQSAWIWATDEVRSHPTFINNALDWLSALQSRAPNGSQEIIVINELQIAAYLCDIFAVNIHAGFETGDKTLLKSLVPKLGFFREHGVRVDAYNRSLHKSLAENFNKRFPFCTLADFQRTAANPASLGRNYVYDLQLAAKVLEHDVGWQGTSMGGGQGFADEMARANVNLSLVEAQIRLLKSWNVLATALCECIASETALLSELAMTAERCLLAHSDTNFEQPRVIEIVGIRMEMAFVIVSALVSAHFDDPSMKTLLPAAWDVVATSAVDYDVATTTGDVRYYRTVLRVLYLSIQPYAYMKPASQQSHRSANATDETVIDFLDPRIGACLVQIVARVVVPGFRALCSNLHENIELALPEDFALLTALLQAVLSVRGVQAVHTQIAEVVCSSRVVRGALSLYSWVDQLADAMEADPIYGELSVMFLLSLSTVRPIAIQIALDRALESLSSANLSNYFRKPNGKGPFSEPHRMFTIWTEGFLQLCLNLLDAVGPPIAAEVATFLNSFPAQLMRAQSALENREPTAIDPHAGSVTLGLVAEARNLCMIALILQSDVSRGAADGIDAADVPGLAFDHVKAKDDVLALVRQRTSLAARIVPVGEREAEWSSRDVGGAGGRDNFLQARIVSEISELKSCYGDD